MCPTETRGRPEEGHKAFKEVGTSASTPPIHLMPTLCFSLPIPSGFSIRLFLFFLSLWQEIVNNEQLQSCIVQKIKGFYKCKAKFFGKHCLSLVETHLIALINWELQMWVSSYLESACSSYQLCPGGGDLDA